MTDSNAPTSIPHVISVTARRHLAEAWKTVITATYIALALIALVWLNDAELEVSKGAFLSYALGVGSVVAWGIGIARGMSMLPERIDGVLVNPRWTTFAAPCALLLGAVL